MWYQLYSSQIYYAIHICAALVFFAAGWLYFDAYSRERSYLRPRIAGFFLLAIGQLFHSVQLQFTGVADSVAGPTWLPVASTVLDLIGYLCIFLSFPFDPIQRRPVTTAFMIAKPFQLALGTFLPIGSFAVSVMYFFHVAEGLEWHLLMPSVSFAVIGLSEIVHLVRVMSSGSTSIFLLSFVAPFGFLWWVELVFLLVGVVLLMRWIFWYLLKSFEMQMVFIATLGVTLLTVCITTLFVGHLFKTLLTEVSNQVTQGVKVFSYNIDSKKREALANARFIAVDTDLIRAVKDVDDEAVRSILEQFSVSRGIRGLMLVNSQGSPIVRSDNDQIFSDMTPYAAVLSSVKQGVESSVMISVPGISSPQIYMVATVPVRSEITLIGAILLAYNLDSAVTQGMKKDLGLEGALFAQDRLAATSMRGADALVGMKETNPDVLENVLVKGQTYEGVVTYDATEYLGSYIPIKNTTEEPVGMMYTGRSTADVFTVVSKAIQGTYVVSTILLLLSIIPALFIAKYIIYQIR